MKFTLICRAQKCKFGKDLRLLISWLISAREKSKASLSRISKNCGFLKQSQLVF